MAAFDLDSAQQAVGHRFADPSLLERAFTHPSWAAEHGGGDYERLEFLGDSVLGFVVAAHLLRAFPERPEGELTRMKSSIVRGGVLAQAAREIGVATLVRTGRGASRGGDAARASVLEAVMEAVIGALFLDGGLDVAAAFVERALAGPLDALGEASPVDDARSRLQELTQANGSGLPVYRTVAVSGPDHAREYVIEVDVAGVLAGRGAGHSKRAAAQAAAADALESVAGD